MPTDINKILRMRKPGGRDVGRALLYSYAISFPAAAEEYLTAPSFTQQDYDNLIKKLDDDEEIANYLCYSSLIIGLIPVIENAQAHQQQAYSALVTLTAMQTEALNHEVILEKSGVFKELAGSAAEKPLSEILDRFNSIHEMYEKPEFNGAADYAINSRLKHSLREIAVFNYTAELLRSLTQVDELKYISISMDFIDTISEQYHNNREEIRAAVMISNSEKRAQLSKIYSLEMVFPPIDIPEIMSIPNKVRQSLQRKFAGLRACQGRYSQILQIIHEAALELK